MSNKRLGLWENTSAKGNTYLSGVDKESGIRYFVFKDDEGKRNLVSKPVADADAKFEVLTALDARVTKTGVGCLKGGKYAIFINEFHEEGSTQPNFNLVIDSE